ncbi:unnamed protein product [Ectocarpus sp. CCAP 1310/34]|nr:unnamed protein product [Ectocarpus sp. CCAP 1310/34]
MLASTSGMSVGLPATLRAAQGLRGQKNSCEQLGGQKSINLDEGEDTRVLEATIGECNNGESNFHERVAEPTKTAKVLRASQTTIKLSNSGTGVFEKNVNDGGCEAHIDAKGNRHYSLLRDYSWTLPEAMQSTVLVAYEKTAGTFTGAEVLLVHKFGNFDKNTHSGRDGMPVVTLEAAIAGRMTVLSVVSKHLSLAPGDTDTLLSIVEGREALKAAGERALAWKKGELDLRGLLAGYTDADRKKSVLDLVEALVTARNEPAEYRGGLDAKKIQKMAQIIEDLRKEEPLAAVLAGVEEVAKLWGPCGYNAKNRSDGGKTSDKKQRKKPNKLSRLK